MTTDKFIEHARLLAEYESIRYEQTMAQLIDTYRKMQAYMAYARSIGCEIDPPDGIRCTEAQYELLKAYWNKLTAKST